MLCRISEHVKTAAVISTPANCAIAAGPRAPKSSATATNETKIENHWHIESMSVREEADIRKVAAQLYRLQQIDARSKGVKL